MRCSIYANTYLFENEIITKEKIDYKRCDERLYLIEKELTVSEIAKKIARVSIN